jgi:hypothetical protein
VFRGTGTSRISIQYELCFRISTLLAKNLGREDRAMEIQTIRGVLIWGYPLSGMNPDFADRASEHNLYAGQKKI